MKTIKAEVQLAPTTDGRDICQEIADRSILIADIASDAAQQIAKDQMETGKADALNRTLNNAVASLVVACRSQKLTPISYNAIEGGE